MGVYIWMWARVLQASMVGKGVVEAVMATLAAVQSGGAPALGVKQAACRTLCNLAIAADNKVQMRGWDRPGCEEYVVRC